MAKAAASAEPSMEEILASILRIIADEPDGKEAAPKAAPAKAAPKPEVETMAEPAPDDEHISEEDLDKLFAQSGDDDETEPEIDVDDADDGDEPEVLDLSDVATVDDDAPLELVEGLKEDEADVAFAEPTPEPVRRPEPPKAEAPRARPAPQREVEPEEPLVSAAATASVQSAFGQLSHTVLAANARTLDDLVKEMLRPMLRGWLDENLPVIVERLVRAEIERVSRGR